MDRDLQSGFRIHESMIDVCSEQFQLYLVLTSTARRSLLYSPTPLGWNSSISSRQAEVVGYFYAMWVFGLWLC